MFTMQLYQYLPSDVEFMSVLTELTASDKKRTSLNLGIAFYSSFQS